MATKKGERYLWVCDLQRATDVLYEVLRFHLNHYRVKEQTHESGFEGTEYASPPTGEPAPLVEMGAMASLLDEVMRTGQYCHKDPESAATVLAEIADVVLPLLEDRAAQVADPVANFAINRAILTLKRLQRDFGERWLGFIEASGPDVLPVEESPPGQQSIGTSQWIA